MPSLLSTGGVGEEIGAYALGVQTVLDPEYEGFRLAK
jgi:hypothetical protein